MNPTYINIEPTEIEKSKMIYIVKKSYSDASDFSFEYWPKYFVVHFHTLLGRSSIMLDKKLKVVKVSQIRPFTGNFKTRLDLYNDKKWITSYVFKDFIEAENYAQDHLNSQKENGYSNSFLEKLKYSLTKIVTIY